MLRWNPKRRNKWNWAWIRLFITILWVSRDSKHVQNRRIKWKPHSALITAALINSKPSETVIPKIKYTLWNGCALMIHQFALKLVHTKKAEGRELIRVVNLGLCSLWHEWTKQIAVKPVLCIIQFVFVHFGTPEGVLHQTHQCMLCHMNRPTNSLLCPPAC